MAIALYSEQLQKARRVDARSGLMRLAMAEERFYALNGSYASQVALGNEFTKIMSELDYDNDVDGNPDYYSFSITLDPDGDAATPDYSITATRVGAQAGDSGDTDCDTFTITETGGQVGDE